MQIQAVQREKWHAAGLHTAATHTPAEMIKPMLDGKRRKMIAKVDPDGTCAPAELERRLAAERKAEMACVRAAKLERQALRERYGRDQPSGRLPVPRCKPLRL